MDSISVEELNEQLESAQLELEAAKAHVYRCDGAIQALEHILKTIEEKAKGA